jgi:hypothetical protein
MFYTSGLIFSGTEGVGSRFLILLVRTHFRRYQGRRVRFSSFALSETFLALPRASGPVFLFCAPGFVSRCTASVRFHFHVLRSRSRFRWYRGRRVPFSCFARPDSFSTVARASGPNFMFCSPRIVFGDIEVVGTHFHVLRSRTHFRRYRERQVPFSTLALPDTFSAVPRAWGLIFMFCVAGLVFGCTEGVRSRIHILRSRTRLRRYRGRQVPLSCFARPNSFSVVPRVF